MNQRDTLELTQAVELVTSQARTFAAELNRDGLLGMGGGMAALEYDLALAQIQVLGRRGLLSASETETAALTALLLQPPEPARAPFEIPIEYTDLELSDLSDPTSPRAISRAYLVLDDITMTEVGTKLDIAKAYLKAGDSEGARSILEDVLQVETEAQQQLTELRRGTEKTSR